MPRFSDAKCLAYVCSQKIKARLHHRIPPVSKPGCSWPGQALSPIVSWGVFSTAENGEANIPKGSFIELSPRILEAQIYSEIASKTSLVAHTKICDLQAAKLWLHTSKFLTYKEEQQKHHLIMKYHVLKERYASGVLSHPSFSRDNPVTKMASLLSKWLNWCRANMGTWQACRWKKYRDMLNISSYFRSSFSP